MMWRGARCRNDNVLHWHLTSHHHSSIFHIKPHFRHSTSFHITPHFTYFNTTRSHGVMSNLVWCATFCNARCGMLYLIHPVAVMWTGKVQCRICATSVVWCCDVVQRQVWNVVMRCGMVWCMGNVAVCWCKMWNVVVEVIPSNAEWFDAQLDMQNDGRNALWNVWCGMECVLWVVWCVFECGDVHGVVRGGMWACEMVCWHVVESRDLKWIMVRCEMWCDVYVKCGAMWNVAFSDLVWCEMQNVRCRMWNVT